MKQTFLELASVCWTSVEAPDVPEIGTDVVSKLRAYPGMADIEQSSVL